MIMCVDEAREQTNSQRGRLFRSNWTTPSCDEAVCLEWRICIRAQSLSDHRLLREAQKHTLLLQDGGFEGFRLPLELSVRATFFATAEYKWQGGSRKLRTTPVFRSPRRLSFL